MDCYESLLIHRITVRSCLLQTKSLQDRNYDLNSYERLPSRTLLLMYNIYSYTVICDDIFACFNSISERYRINEYVSTVVHITFGQITWSAENFFDYLCSARASGLQTGLNNRNRLPLDWPIFPLKSHLLNSTSSTQMTSFPLDVDNATITFTCAQWSQENSLHHVFLFIFYFSLYWAWTSRWLLQMYWKKLFVTIYISFIIVK